MNSNTHLLSEKSTRMYLSHISSLKCIWDHFKDRVSDTMKSIDEIWVMKHDLNKHGISQDIQDLAVNEKCRSILSELKIPSVVYEVLKNQNFHKNNR